MINNVIRDVFRVNLGVKKHERVLIFSDKISKKEHIDKLERARREKLSYLSLLFAEIGKNLCKSIILYEYPATCSHGAEPPPKLWQLAFGEKAIERLRKENFLIPLLKKTMNKDTLKKVEYIINNYKNNAINCVIALSNYSTSHTRFRDFLTRICGCRYASMPLFDISMLEGAMNVDWKALAERTIQVAKEINKAEFIKVITTNGTSITFSKKGRRARSDTGILTRKGSFGNLPAGEVYLAPLEGTSQGKLVVEWGPTEQLKYPLTLTVKDGNVVNVSGRDAYIEHLKKKLSERKENANIAEFGIGTNDAACRPYNILESEKILGTIHIALGDNSSFGGKVITPYHQDFVFFNPTVTLFYKDGRHKVLIESGRLLC